MVTVSLRSSIAFALGLSTLASAAPALGAEYDFKVIDGILVQPLVLPDDQIAEVAGREGAIYYIDLRQVTARLGPDPRRLEARTPITIAGYEGQRPDQLSAHTLEVRGAAPPPVASFEPRRSVDLRMFEGVVQSVTRRVLNLRTADGRTLAVRIGSLVSSSYPFLRGQRLKVLGVVNEDETLAASAVIHEAPPRATPLPASPSPAPQVTHADYGP